MKSYIKRVFRELKPRRILETGAHLGTGTTRIIGEAIREAGLSGVQFISIEVNPDYARQARENTQSAGIDVDIRHGLSVPRGLLPTPAQVKRDLIDNVDPAVFVDHAETERVQLYVAETGFAGVEDDLLGKALRDWNGKVDFLLLDSAGHMGFIEFQYALSQLKAPCMMMLDDTHHVKHHPSLLAMKKDKRFTIEVDSREKFGYVLAHFQPGGCCGGVFQQVANLLRRGK